MTTARPGPERYTVEEVDVPVRALSRFEPLIGPERYADLRHAAAQARRRLRGVTVWNVNSTARGGGVAEMLEVLVGYIEDAGIDIRWHVVAGDDDFFSVTKRIHNRLHGVAGDNGALGPSEAAHYASVTAAHARQVRERVRRGDVVLLHDPQTAGMAAALAGAGARVVWRCHIGREDTNRWTDEAWSFLRPHLAACEAFVFTRHEYVPSWIDGSRVRVIPPSIDPFSPKNQELAAADVGRILRGIGLLAPAVRDRPGTFTRNDGTPGRIGRTASITPADSPLDPGAPLVLQVSRWDRLKDMAGVLEGFALAVARGLDADLALVGPDVRAVADDPEGAAVFAECVAAREALPDQIRRRVRLVALPMDDVDENAAMVNALQRHATVIVQKSLMEGFGLTVAEGMWKGRPVVASRVGGITDQIAPGTGVLLDDPTDLAGFAVTLADLLAHPEEMTRLGESARRHVQTQFVGDQHLVRYAALVEWLAT